jgi:hypothetical protein
MRIVEVQTFRDNDFGILLKEMRLWLDETRFEPSTFIYSDLSPGVSIQIAFKIGEEAEAFSRRFRGCLKRRVSNA